MENLIYSKKKAWFEKELSNVPDSAIAFIGDTKEIYALGLYFAGGSSGSSAYPIVEHGTNDTTFTLTPNTFHVWDEVTSLNLSFGDETAGVVNEYLFLFTSGTTATTLIIPDNIEWVGGTPVIGANKTYQVSIVEKIGIIVGV